MPADSKIPQRKSGPRAWENRPRSVNIMLKAEDDAALSAIADRMGVSRSAVVRLLIRDANHQKWIPSPSALDGSPK